MSVCSRSGPLTHSPRCSAALPGPGTLRSLPGRTALWTWEDGPAGSQVGGALPDNRPSSWVALPGRGGAPRTWDLALLGPGSAPSHLGARALPPGSAPSQHLGPRAPSLGPRAPRSKVPGGSEVPTWEERTQIKVPGCQKRSLMAPPRAVPNTLAALKICVHKDPPRSFGHAGTRTLKYPAQRMLCNLSAPGSPLSEGPRSWPVLPGPKGRPPRQGAQGPRPWERDRTSG